MFVSVRKARQGALMPTYAYLGYRWSEVDDRGHKKPGARLLVDEVEASLARLIFEKYPCLTNGGLAKWLNANGYRLPCKSPARHERHGRSDRLFDSKAITDIISNDLYTGTLSWGKTTKVEGQNPEEFRHHVPELQIVSFEALARAQEARADQRRVLPRSPRAARTPTQVCSGAPSAVVRLSGRDSGTSRTAIVRRGGTCVADTIYTELWRVRAGPPSSRQWTRQLFLSWWTF